jgi:hypothetical protein
MLVRISGGIVEDVVPTVTELLLMTLMMGATCTVPVAIMEYGNVKTVVDAAPNTHDAHVVTAAGTQVALGQLTAQSIGY